MKPVSDFYPRKSGYGLARNPWSGWCRECHNAYSRQERRRYRLSHRAELATDEWRRYHGRRRDPPIDWG